VSRCARGIVVQVAVGEGNGRAARAVGQALCCAVAPIHGDGVGVGAAGIEQTGVERRYISFGDFWCEGGCDEGGSHVVHRHGEGVTGTTAVVVGHGQGHYIDAVVVVGVSGCQAAGGTVTIAKVPGDGVRVEAAGVGEHAAECDGRPFIHRLVWPGVYHGRQIVNGNLQAVAGSLVVTVGDGEEHRVDPIVGVGVRGRQGVDGTVAVAEVPGDGVRPAMRVADRANEGDGLPLVGDDIAPGVDNRHGRSDGH